MTTLYLLNVCVPKGKGWLPPQVFESTELLDQEEKKWKDEKCSTVVNTITDSEGAALRKYFSQLSVQTRSDETGLWNGNSLKDAIARAEEDQSIWKISFSLLNGERIRLVRDLGDHSFTLLPL